MFFLGWGRRWGVIAVGNDEVQSGDGSAGEVLLRREAGGGMQVWNTQTNASVARMFGGGGG